MKFLKKTTGWVGKYFSVGGRRRGSTPAASNQKNTKINHARIEQNEDPHLLRLDNLW